MGDFLRPGCVTTFDSFAATANTAMDRAGVSAEDVDWIVPHQANIRIIQGTAKKLWSKSDSLCKLNRNGHKNSKSTTRLAMNRPSTSASKKLTSNGVRTAKKNT